MNIGAKSRWTIRGARFCARPGTGRATGDGLRRRPGMHVDEVLAPKQVAGNGRFHDPGSDNAWAWTTHGRAPQLRYLNPLTVSRLLGRVDDLASRGRGILGRRGSLRRWLGGDETPWSDRHQ